MKHKSFTNKSLNVLQCLARIHQVYWRSNEESVEGDRLQRAPALESRETVYAANSRADRVQGIKIHCLFQYNLIIQYCGSLLFIFSF